MAKNFIAVDMKPPKHLRKETAKWFASVVQEYDLQEHHLKLLTLAAESWDRGCDARESLALHGIIYTDRFGAPRKRPEISIEEASRIAFARLCRELDLDCGTPAEPKRPPALHSNRR